MEKKMEYSKEEYIERISREILNRQIAHIYSKIISSTECDKETLVLQACLKIIETILEKRRDDDAKKLASGLLRFSSYLCARYGISIEDAFDDFWVHFLTEKETAYLHIVEKIE
jgi:hypothetical protein